MEHQEIFNIKSSELKERAHLIIDLITDLWEDSEKKIFPERLSDHQLEKTIGRIIPRDPGDFKCIMKLFEKDIIPAFFKPLSPSIFQLISSPLPLPSLIECFTSFLNIQPYSQINTHIEKTVLKWIGSLIGFSENAAGIISNSGTHSNLYALTVARVKMASWNVRKEGNNSKLTVYSSIQCHPSIDKAIEMLGIGNNQLRKIPIDKDFHINIELLENAILEDLDKGYYPFCIVGNIGSANTGSVDSIEQLSIIAQKYNLWLHLDGAYGGFAAIVPEKKSLFKDISQCNSITLDPHKWLNIPYESSCLLVKEWSDLSDSFNCTPDYLNASSFDDNNLWDSNYELTRSDRALKIWFAFKVYGINSFIELIKYHLKIVQQLSETINELYEFELLSKPDLSICCFRYIPSEIEKHKEKMIFYLNNLNKAIALAINSNENAFITTTMINGITYLRVCVINYSIKENHLINLINKIKIHAG